METVNARIKSTMLGIEDHGIMTFYLHLEWQGAGQGLGGYSLDGHDKEKDTRVGCGVGVMAIRKILEVVGVSNWEDLAGELVRAKVGLCGDRTKPIIGNIMEDKWFDIEQFYSENKS